MFVEGSEFGMTEWADKGVGVEVCEVKELLTGADAFSPKEALFDAAFDLSTSPRVAARGRSKFIRSTEQIIAHRHANMSPRDLVLRMTRNANLLLIDILSFQPIRRNPLYCWRLEMDFGWPVGGVVETRASVLGSSKYLRTSIVQRCKIRVIQRD